MAYEQCAPSPFGPGTGLIGLDNVDCSGTETMLTDCTARTSTIHNMIHNCGHNEDAGVSCPNGTLHLLLHFSCAEAFKSIFSLNRGIFIIMGALKHYRCAEAFLKH